MGSVLLCKVQGRLKGTAARHRPLPSSWSVSGWGELGRRGLLHELSKRGLLALPPALSVERQPVEAPCGQRRRGQPRVSHLLHQQQQQGSSSEIAGPFPLGPHTLGHAAQRTCRADEQQGVWLPAKPHRHPARVGQPELGKGALRGEVLAAHGEVGLQQREGKRERESKTQRSFKGRMATAAG